MYMEGQETDKTHCWFVPMTLEKRILDAPDKWREKSERGRHDGSKLFKWHTLTLSCCNMTFHSQLTVANSGAGCLPLLDNESFKFLQGCS